MVARRLVDVNLRSTRRRPPIAKNGSKSVHRPLGPRKLVAGLVYGVGCDGHCVRNMITLLTFGGWQIKMIAIESVRCQGALDGLDVLIVGGGDDDDNRIDTREGRRQKDNHYGIGQRRALGEAGMDAIRRHVEAGLHYVGICAGAYLASAKTVAVGEERGASNLRLCEVDIFNEEVFASGIDGAVELSAGESSSCDAKLRCLLRRSPAMRFSDSAIFRVLDRRRVTVLATYKRPIVERTLELQVPRDGAGNLAYAGKHRYLQHKRKMVGRPAVVMSHHGKGRVLLFGPHPELHSQNPGQLPAPSSRTVLSDLITHVTQK